MNPSDMTTQEKIDYKQALTAQMEALQGLIADVDHAIMTDLLQSGEKRAFGSEGLGYALYSVTRYDFGKEAYRYLEEKGLLDRFVAEPKITRGKLDTLLKEGALTPVDMAALAPHTHVEQSPYSLRKVSAPKERGR